MAKCRIKSSSELNILLDKMDYIFEGDIHLRDIENNNMLKIVFNKKLAPAEISTIKVEFPDYDIRIDEYEGNSIIRIPIDTKHYNILLSKTVDDLLNIDKGISVNSVIQFKRIQLNRVKEEIKSIYKEIKISEDSKEKVKELKLKLKELAKKEQELEDFISNIREEISRIYSNKGIEEDETEIYEMLTVFIKKDIKNIEELLNDVEFEVVDFKNVEDSLKFYIATFSGLTIDGIKVDTKFKEVLTEKDLSSINNKLKELYITYLNKLEQVRDNIINNEPIFNEIGELYGDWKIKELVSKSKDINWLEKTFLGIGISSTDENIVPQVVKRIFERAVVEEEAQILKFKKELNLLIKKFDERGINEEELIIEKTKYNTRTGNIIHYYTYDGRRLFSILWRQVSESFSSFSENKKLYKLIKEEFDFIDIRKIRKVKELFGDIDDFKPYFKFTEEEMIKYEEELKKKFGRLYDKFVNDAIDKISKYYDIYNDNKYTKVKKSNNPFEVISYLENRKKYLSDKIKIKTNYITLFPKFEKNGKKTDNYNYEFFDKIIHDDDLYRYWEIMTEIYTEYVNPIYSDRTGLNLSYAKFEKQWLEEIKESKHFYGTNLFKKVLSSYKSLFFEKGFYKKQGSKVLKNYKDNTKEEISKLAEALRSHTKEGLIELAKEYDIKLENNIQEYEDLFINLLAKEIVYSKYSSDLNKVTFAILDKAALQRARERVYPVIDVLYNTYKKQLNDEHEKTNSILKLKQWIDRVIKGELEKYTGSTSFFGRKLNYTWIGTVLDKFGKLPIIKLITTTPLTRYYNEIEKEIISTLLKNRDTLDTFVINNVTYTKINNSYFLSVDGNRKKISEEEYFNRLDEYINNVINNSGIPLTISGLINGILKTIIIKALAFNPISGIFNRVEGKNSGLLMDATGYFWTKGNIHKANSFLAFSNLINFSSEKLDPIFRKKVKELKKLKLLNEYWSIIQDRKNELERQVEKSGYRYISKLNPYLFAVDAPEFKNQNAILLSILGDIKVKDINGKEHPLFDLDKGEFTIYDITENGLKLKENFRTQENIESWEQFRGKYSNGKETEYFKARMKIKNAISRSQGNYDNLDVIYATKPIYGRALTLFLKWMPEHVMQRFSSGKNFNINTKKRDLKGRYRTLIERPYTILPYGIISSIISFGLSPVTGFASLGFIGYVMYKYFKDIYSTDAIKQEAYTILEMSNFLKSFIIETFNYPLEILNINKKLHNNSYERMIGNKMITEEDANNLVAMTKELAIRLTWVSLLILGKSLTWDDEDEEKKKVANFIDNRINRIIQALSVWNNPKYFLQDMKNLAFIRYMERVGKLAQDIAILDEDRLIKDALYLSPVPTLLQKGDLPYKDEVEWNKGQWFDTFVMDLKTDGEYSAKKEFIERRKELKEKFEKKYKGKYVDKAFNKIYKPKQKYETYKEALERLKQIDIDVKKIKEESLLNIDKIKYNDVRGKLFVQFKKEYKGDKKNLLKEFRKKYPPRRKKESYEQAYNRLKIKLKNKRE